MFQNTQLCDFLTYDSPSCLQTASACCLVPACPQPWDMGELTPGLSLDSSEDPLRAVRAPPKTPPAQAGEPSPWDPKEPGPLGWWLWARMPSCPVLAGQSRLPTCLWNVLTPCLQGAGPRVGPGKPAALASPPLASLGFGREQMAAWPERLQKYES